MTEISRQETEIGTGPDSKILFISRLSLNVIVIVTIIIVKIIMIAIIVIVKLRFEIFTQTMIGDIS